MIDLLYQISSKISAETRIECYFLTIFYKGSILTNSNPLILALEASAGQASAGLSQGPNLLASLDVTAAHGHAAWMVTLAQDVLAKAGQSPQNLDMIIGGIGPGSFTGIRVALAAAKGFGLTQNITPVGISSLAGLAAMAHHQAKPILSVIDSRRKSYFVQLFDADLHPLSPIIDGGLDAVMAMLETHHDKTADGLVVTGYDAELIAETLQQKGLNSQVKGNINPSAEGLIKAFQIAPDLSADPEPLYLAPPILGKSSQTDNK